VCWGVVGGDLLIQIPKALEDLHELSSSKEFCGGCPRCVARSFLVVGGSEYIAREILHVGFSDDFIGDRLCGCHTRFCLFEGIEEGGQEDVCLGILQAQRNSILHGPVVALAESAFSRWEGEEQ